MSGALEGLQLAAKAAGNQSEGLGFLGVAIAVVFFGTNFIPVKKYKTGDGMFFQWVMCAGVWTFGLFVQAMRGFPAFQPFAMLGGAFWCSGNVMTVAIIKCIGLGMGLLLWGCGGLITGWMCGTFGILLVEKETVPNPTFNYIGFVFAVVSIGMFAFVDSDNSSEKPGQELPHKVGTINESPADAEEELWIEKLPESTKKTTGIAMALLAGFFYGINFNPPTHLMEHGHSQNGLDYVFSHFCGIFVTSTLYLIIYCVATKNNPKVYPEIILPGFISGVMWAVAQSAWFIANANLSMVVAFPLITTGPGLIGALLGVFLFGEIRGRRNYLVLTVAFLTTGVGIMFITLSKVAK